jgi:hypothetical protein
MEVIEMRRSNEGMLRRLAANGFPVDFDALRASFNLTITPITSIDVDADPLIQFSQRVRKQVKESGFKCGLADIAIFTMVLNPEIKAAGDSSSWKKSSQAYVIRRNIDFSSWQSAKPSGKNELLRKCVIDSIADIPMKHLDESSKETLAGIIRQAARVRRTSGIAKSSS